MRCGAGVNLRRLLELSEAGSDSNYVCPSNSVGISCEPHERLRRLNCYTSCHQRLRVDLPARQLHPEVRWSQLRTLRTSKCAAT